MTTEISIILLLGFVWKLQLLVISFVYLPQWGGYRYTGLILYENSSQPAQGSPGISDWSHAVISKSLLNAAGPAPAHLSSEIIVCLACCPTPEIKSQLDRTVLSLTVTMTETWSSHYWSADRSYLRSRFVLQHSSLIHSHRVECAIYVWDFQYNVYKMYICNSHSSISFFNWGHLSC